MVAPTRDQRLLEARERLELQAAELLQGRGHPLLDTLDLLVPLRIQEMQGMSVAAVEAALRGPQRVDADGRPKASTNGQMLGEQADVLLFGGTAAGGVLGVLVDGLAGLAVLCPGGVRAFGSHWEAAHPDLVLAEVLR